MGIIAREPDNVHAHDRTMLASLGFADRDKGDVRHDLACQYLATPEVAEKVIIGVVGPTFERRELPYEQGADYYPSKGGRHSIAARSWRELAGFEKADLEFLLGKGEGKYRTTVGFLDVVITYKVRQRTEGIERRYTGEHEEYWVNHEGRECAAEFGHSKRSRAILEERPYKQSKLDRHTIIVEVKAHPVGVGSILRQVNLYREYVGSADHWALATLYPLPSPDVETLRVASIAHLYLGEAFDQWCQAREAEPSGPGSAGSVEL